MSSDESDRLLNVVQAIAISPDDAKSVVRHLRAQSERAWPNDDDDRHRERVADHIISRYCVYASTSGGLTGRLGVVPGLGTALAAIGGGATDIAISMKLQVDMCMCLAEAFGHDVSSADGKHLAFLIAAGAALEKAGVEAGARVASKAGVQLLRQYMKGAALQVLKGLFKKLGITFTHKALEKALPFDIGVAFGVADNYAMTRYVGRSAEKWFVLDQEA